MDFKISEGKLFAVMKVYYESRMKEPLPEIVKKSYSYFSGNSGWGSSMHDYTGMNTKYLDGDGRVLFLHFDNRFASDSTWEVNDIFQSLYDFFGEETFEFFVKKVYNLDITEKGKKAGNWVFGISE